MHARRMLTAALAVGLGVVLTACADDDSEPVLAPPLETGEPAPTAYDPELAPARAVLPLVPAEATLLEVTDFDQVRLQLGVGDLTGRSPAAERAAFWQRAEQESPLLSDGLLKPSEPALAAYGITQDDVSWEAHFTTGSGEGWVLKLSDDLDLDGPARAVSAGVGPLAGADFDPQTRLLRHDAAPDTGSSWAAEDDLAAIVPDGAAQATYVARECDAVDVSGEVGDLTELGPFSVSFGGTLVTARLGEERTDVFDRSALLGDERFDQAFADVVADPGTGRLGYRLADPALAADLAQQGRLPFAACA